MSAEAAVSHSEKNALQHHTRLDAVMVTDIVGYSKMMRENALRTLQLREEHERRMTEWIQEFQPRIIKNTGDGFLVVFGSSRQAIECAISLQRNIVKCNQQSHQEDRYQVRIGLHHGDVEEWETDAFSDCINVAARILAYAAPGGICMSAGFAGDILGYVTSNSLHSLGKQRLKNIRPDIELYHLWPGA